MRRRLALGLADPLLANRFVLWAVWTGALGFAGLLIFAVRSRAVWLQGQGIDPRSAMPDAIPFTAVSVGCAVRCAASRSGWPSSRPADIGGGSTPAPTSPR